MNKKIVSIIFLIFAVFISLALGSYKYLVSNNPASLPYFVETFKEGAKPGARARGARATTPKITTRATTPKLATRATTPKPGARATTPKITTRATTAKPSAYPTTAKPSAYPMTRK